jgi:hypothetical protein
VTNGLQQTNGTNISSNWRKGVLVALLVLTGVPFYGWLIWWRYSHRPKADTIGYAELHESTGRTVRLVVRPNWLVRYRGRNRARPHEADVEDENGQLQFTIYYGRLANPITTEGYARQTMAQWNALDLQQKGGWEVEQQEFRERRNERIWLQMLVLHDGQRYGSKHFGGQPVVRIRYAVPWGDGIRIFEFDMLPSRVAELEPIVWRMVSEATEVRPNSSAG